MTTANQITVFRILLVPVFIYLLVQFRETGTDWLRLAAVAAFGVAALLDGVDGFVARRFNQRSDLGAVLDPLGDKLLLVSGLIMTGLQGRHLAPLPTWLNTVVISRDVIILLGMALIHYTVGTVKVRPRWTGKVATVLQMAAVLWCLLKLRTDWQMQIAFAAAAFTAASGAQYIWDGIRQLNASPRSAPKPSHD